MPNKDPERRREVNLAAVNAYRARTDNKRGRQLGAARMRALTRLANHSPEVFDIFYRDECRKAGIAPPGPSGRKSRSTA